MRFFKLLSLTLCAAFLFSGTALAAEGGTQADLVFTNGVIFTADAENTIASALAVKEGKILYVGGDEDALAFAGEGTDLRDLEGAFVMPGLIDAHIHSILPSFFDMNVLDCTTMDELLTLVSDYIAAHPDQKSYFAFGYGASLVEGEEVDKGPRKEWLDEICPDKPLALMSSGGHELWANSVFLANHGLTADSESPRGGTIVKDEETGELWGTMKDTAMQLSEDDLYNFDTLLRELPKLVDGCNSLGFTGIVSVSAYDIMPVPFEAYRQLEEADNLNIRVYGTTGLGETNWEADIERAVATREKYDTDLIKMNTLKVFVDGAVDTRTSLLLEPYEGTTDNYGQAAWEQSILDKAFALANENGIQLHVHAIGDGAARMALDAMAYAKANAPEGDYRNALTHVQLMSEEDKARLGDLDVSIVAQPFWHYRVHGFTDEAETTAVGADRVSKFYPMKSLQDGGALIASSSDFPFTADPNPFIGMEVGVTRNLVDGADDQVRYNLPSITDMDDPAQLLAPEERLTIEDMIRSYTINAAYTVFADKEIGSLETGKAADLVIVDQNLLEVEPLRISHTKVLQTWLGGQLVYEAE